MSATTLAAPRPVPLFVIARRSAADIPPKLRAGTRGSPLAQAQTRAVVARLRQADPDLIFGTEIIRTTGDAVQDCRLADIGGKGLFAKEIHQALLDGQIDFAVHSLKDLETELPAGIALACVLPREDPRDVLLLAADIPVPEGPDPFATLPPCALIGSCSVRRQAQLLAVRPDLQVAVIRGNVETRLAKLGGGSFAATFLALAGLRRLNRKPAASVILEPEMMLPAAGQGIVGVTVRADDTRCVTFSAGPRIFSRSWPRPRSAPCYGRSTAPARRRSARSRDCCPAEISVSPRSSPARTGRLS